MKDKSYSKSFHDNTVQLIKNHLDELFEGATSAVSLIDLGPGYPDKSLPMTKFLRKNDIDVHYYPVDISLEYLRISESEMAHFCKTITPIHALFERASEVMPDTAYGRNVYVLIGLTFMNFPHKYILDLLKKIASTDKGQIIFASELITKQNTEEKILDTYRGQAVQTLAFGPLKHLGLKSESAVYTPKFDNHRVEMSFVLQEDLPALSLNEGDSVITAVSYRYTNEEMTQILQDNFSECRTWYSLDKKTILVLGKL